MNRNPSKNEKLHEEPTIAPGMEMDELEAGATAEEKQRGDVTEVTKLVIDRVPDEG